MKDYYYILGLTKWATSEDIGRAYRKLTLKFHPDKTDNDPFFNNMFLAIQEAYQILSSPEKRKKYDASYVSFNISGGFAENQSRTQTKQQPKAETPKTDNLGNTTHVGKASRLALACLLALLVPLIFVIAKNSFLNSLSQKGIESSSAINNYPTDTSITESPNNIDVNSWFDYYPTVKKIKLPHDVVRTLKKARIDTKLYQKMLNESLASNGPQKAKNILVYTRIVDYVRGGSETEKLFDSFRMLTKEEIADQSNNGLGQRYYVEANTPSKAEFLKLKVEADAEFDLFYNQYGKYLDP